MSEDRLYSVDWGVCWLRLGETLLEVVTNWPLLGGLVAERLSTLEDAREGGHVSREPVFRVLSFPALALHLLDHREQLSSDAQTADVFLRDFMWTEEALRPVKHVGA